ncbi:MAG: carboxypeptidase regulatory-like domain-containing protein [Acidobacteriaceae bacterium]
MIRTRYWLLILWCAVCLSLTPMYAQQTSGQVIGLVTDSSGAAVADVPVTISQPSTGFTRTVQTNGSGEYTVPDVPPGTYQMSVSAPNFKQFTTQNIVVNVATTNTVNAQLQVGSQAQEVTVQDSNVQVQTDNATLGEVVDGNQVKELPLNGRSFVELTLMNPGVSPANNFDTKNKGLQGGVDMSVNGNPTTNNLFLIDGVNNNDTGSNRTILIYPSNEAIAEFKMLTNSMSAQYGQASGAIISIITRSGTNAFHGSAFYDGRNDALNSYNYFATQNAGKGLPENGKDKLRRNDWGYSIGGPIKKDKLFFFFSEEWNHEIRGRTLSACVPTAAEEAGDFSTTSLNSTVSCQQQTPTIPAQFQAPGNKLALAAVDPAAATLMKMFPLPTRATLDANGNNWSQSLSTGLYWREENVRVDYNITPRNVISGRYTQDSWTNPAFNAGYWGDTPFPALDSSWAQPSKSIMGRWTSTISNSMVNDVAFQYSNNRIIITPGGTNPGLLGQITSAIPTLYSESLKNSKQGVPQVTVYGTQTALIAPWQNQLDLYSAQDDLSKVWGRHTLRFGTSLDWDGKNEDTGPAASERPTLTPSDGSVATGGARTGNTLANILVPGNPLLISETSTNVRAQLRWRDYEFYAMDTVKLTPRLTLNAGLRYSIMPPTFQPNNQITSFQPQLYNPALPATDACNGLWVAPGKDPCGAANAQFGTNFSHGVPGPNKYLVNVNYHQFAPRVGVVYDLLGNGRTVLSAGGGQFFQRERVSRYTLVANAPFAINTSNYARSLGGATPASLQGGTTSPAGGIEPRAILPNSWQWNVSLQQQLNPNTLFQISYVGNRGIHLTSTEDINQIPQQNWLAASFVNGGAQTALRPFSNYNTLTYWTHAGNSYYAGLQTLVKTRLKALQLQGAYTWSHAIANIVTDDSGGGLGQQTFTYYPDQGLDRGNSNTNRPNIFIANAIYFLPQLTGHNTLMRGTLGGWELSGIVSAANGNSFTIFQGASENTALVQTVLNPATGLMELPPGAGSLNALAQTGFTSPQRPLRVPGQSCVSGRKGSQVINPNAFTLVGYPIGTIPSNVAPRGYCGGPNFNNTDFSVDKNWKVKERVTLQFRMDFFDVFNHANFNASSGSFTPVSGVNCGAPNQNSLYSPCSPTNNVITLAPIKTGFGTSNATIGNAARQLQYTLHINF